MTSVRYEKTALHPNHEGNGPDLHFRCAAQVGCREEDPFGQQGERYPVGSPWWSFPARWQVKDELVLEVEAGWDAFPS